MQTEGGHSVTEKILLTNTKWTPTILRITLGIVLFPHGAQKMLGWFAGPGFAGEMYHLTVDLGLSWIIALLVILIEFFGALFILAGGLTRINAFAIFVLFVGIIFTAHLEHGFFMNWFGEMPAGQEGFEYHLLVLGMAAALFLSGGGKYALDSLLIRRSAAG